jgi:hypothetical protein
MEVTINNEYDITNFILKVPQNLLSFDLKKDFQLASSIHNLKVKTINNSMDKFLGGICDINLKGAINSYNTTESLFSITDTTELKLESVVRNKIENYGDVFTAKVGTPAEVIISILDLFPDLWQYFDIGSLLYSHGLMESYNCRIDGNYSGDLYEYLKILASVMIAPMIVWNNKVIFRSIYQRQGYYLDLTPFICSLDVSNNSDFLYNNFELYGYDDFNDLFKASRDQYGEQKIELPSTISIYPFTFDSILSWINYYQAICSQYSVPKKRYKITLPKEIDIFYNKNYLIRGDICSIFKMTVTENLTELELMKI